MKFMNKNYYKPNHCIHMDDKDHDDEVYETAIDPTFVKEKIQILENDDQPLSYTQSNIESFIEACEVLCDLRYILLLNIKVYPFIFLIKYYGFSN